MLLLLSKVHWLNLSLEYINLFTSLIFSSFLFFKILWWELWFAFVDHNPKMFSAAVTKLLIFAHLHICSIYGFIWLLLTSGSKRFYIFGYKCDCSTIYGYKCDCNTIYVFDLAKFDKIKNKIIILESFSFWSFQYNDVKLCSYL